MARKLRIATSIFFGVLTVALCVLWGRSYLWWDSVQMRGLRSGHWRLDSSLGIVYCTWSGASRDGIWQWKKHSGAITPESLWTAWFIVPGYQSAAVPIWLLAFAAAALSATPWMPWRFSLRTLLIATTLLAVALGLGVWLAP